MKKNYFIALIALLTFAMNIKAQEINNWEPVNAPQDTEETTDGYNMVVTLPDGTTFTVNTNDVDEVKFTNGKVTISGASVQWLMEKCYELLDRHYQLRVEVADQLAEQDKKIQGVEEWIGQILMDIVSLNNVQQTQTDEIKKIFDVNEELNVKNETTRQRIEALESIVARDEDSIKKLEGENAAMMERIYMLEDKNSKLELINGQQDEEINEMKMKIEILEVKVKADEEKINNLYVAIELLHKALENLQQRVESLESK